MTPPKSPSKESEGGHFITKRKRKRVRKHKKTQAAPVEISTHSSFTDTSPHIQAHPSLHFKFEYDNEDDDRVNIVSLKNGNDDRETNIDFNNICSDKETLEEKITKAPLIEGIVPNEGDVVAFKVSVQGLFKYKPHFFHTTLLLMNKIRVEVFIRDLLRQKYIFPSIAFSNVSHIICHHSWLH